MKRGDPKPLRLCLEVGSEPTGVNSTQSDIIGRKQVPRVAPLSPQASKTRGAASALVTIGNAVRPPSPYPPEIVPQ